MSAANKEEVGVPIKKRPVSSSGRSATNMLLPWMKSSSSELEVSTLHTLNTSKQDTNIINKGKGITNSRILDHATRSFTLPMANSKGVLLDGSNEIFSCAEIDRSTALLYESKDQKLPAMDLQLTSCRNDKNSYSSVKEEKADQCFAGLHSAQPCKNVQIASEINAPSNICFGKLPNLDLNMPLDPVDSDEGLPPRYERGNGPYHGSIQCQNAQLPTISSGPGCSIESLNLPDSYWPSHKCGPGDVTLDLQLKPPARPEIGKNWKGLVPDPEFSLSLSASPKPIALSAPNGLFNSGPALSLKNVSKVAATVGSNKSPIEEATHVPCQVDPQNTSPTVTITDNTVHNNMVKTEPEGPSLHTPNDAGKAYLLEQQNVGLVNSCAEYEKTDSASQAPSKARFDLNSGIFPNCRINNGCDTITDNVPIPVPSLPDTVPTEDRSIVATKIQKSVKREEATAVPSPAVATVSDDVVPVSMVAQSLSSATNVVNHAVESSIQPPASHINSHEDKTRRPGDALQLQNSSSPITAPLIHNSRGYTANDGMSQGSAEMDCSDDDDNTAFQLRSQGGPSGNGPTTEVVINVSNIQKEIKKELGNDTRQYCSSLPNKVSMEDVNDEKCVKIRDGIVCHSGEEENHREVFANEESKENQLLKLDKICMVNKTDNSMYDVKTATGSCYTGLQKLLALRNPASSEIGSIKKFPATLDSCPQKARGLDLKTENSLSLHGKLPASLSEDYAKKAAAKSEHGTEIEGVNQSGICPRDSVIVESLGIDGASSSEPHSSCGRVKAASENSDEKSKPDSYMTNSVSNERDSQIISSHRSQIISSHRKDLEYAYVNRNERWERFMESEQEKTKGGYQDSRLHGPDMINQRRTDHRYGGRGTGPRGYQRNFRGPRMSNECPFEDDLGRLHRMPHRRHHSPPAVCRRGIDTDGFPGRENPDPMLLAHGQIEDLPNDMIEEGFFRPHSHRHIALGDPVFIHTEKSHLPAQRRGRPVHFHRGRSPEAMHRSPPLLRTERMCLPYRRHTRRPGSPLDRMGHDDRGMQRNTRRCGVIGSQRALEEDAFEPPLHPAHLGGLHAEEELMDRRKYRDRRPRPRSLEEAPADNDEMFSYHLEEEMEFADCDGPQELDGRLRNRMGHRGRGEQDSCRHRGPQGWRDVESNNDRPKKRRY